MTKGAVVAEFEREFAAYVGGKYAIGACNGTASIHMALAALQLPAGTKVQVPCLTMSSTTIAVLHAGCVPHFVDVEPDTWLMQGERSGVQVPVSLYGLCRPRFTDPALTIDDAAQTLRQHSGAAFTSYSFEGSKVLSCGEGGCLVTDSEELAARARSFGSLGYKLSVDSPRIDPAVLKSPTYERHHSLGWNYRLNDLSAAHLLDQDWDQLKADRRRCADLYAKAIEGVDWLTPQHVPEGWTSDYWTFAVAATWPEKWYRQDRGNGWYAERMGPWGDFANLIVKHGGERPYGAWLPPWKEPGLASFVERGNCPVAENLQPRLLQMSTNDFESAYWNALALVKAIKEIGG